MDAGRKWHLFVDGASRNNPGPSGAGIFILKNGNPFIKEGFFLGLKTNNQAEYLALLIGLFSLKQYWLPDDHVTIISDSQLLVRQMLGEYKVKNRSIKNLFVIAQELINEFDSTITHVLRYENKEADKMANHGIDIKNPLPEHVMQFFKERDVFCNE